VRWVFFKRALRLAGCSALLDGGSQRFDDFMARNISRWSVGGCYASKELAWSNIRADRALPEQPDDDQNEDDDE
jgi:hypothetical protein